MDDLLKALKDAETAIALALELISMCNCGGFKLTKFMSNDQEVLKALPPSVISPNRTLDLDAEHIERALGVIWDTVSDTFTFRFRPKQSPRTKRGMMQVIASLFDPPGFVSPFILNAKILLQEIWRQGLDWDEEINTEIAKGWDNWLSASKNLENIKIERCYIQSTQTILDIQLHIFSDASEKAYGAVGYLRFT